MRSTGRAGGAVGTPTEIVTGSAAWLDPSGGSLGAVLSEDGSPPEQPARAKSIMAEAMMAASVRFMLRPPILIRCLFFG